MQKPTNKVKVITNPELVQKLMDLPDLTDLNICYTDDCIPPWDVSVSAYKEDTSDRDRLTHVAWDFFGDGYSFEDAANDVLEQHKLKVNK